MRFFILYISLATYFIKTAGTQESMLTTTKEFPSANLSSVETDMVFNGTFLNTTNMTTTEPIPTPCGVSNKNNCPVPSEPSVLESLTSTDTIILYINYVTVPTFLLISLVGNSLTVMVMLRKPFKNLPYSVILIALAVSDSTYCVVFPFSKLFVRHMIGYDLRALSEIGCHIFFIVHKASKICSSWYIVCICLERFCVVWMPLRAKIICSKRNSTVLVLLVTLGILLLTGFWTFSTKIVNGACVPNVATPETAVAARAYLIAGSTMFSIVPASILLVTTLAICYKLMQQSKMRKSLMADQSTESQRMDLARTNAMLLAVSIAYLVLVTPTGVAHNVCFSLGVNFYESRLYSMIVTRAVLQVMEQLNFSMNFLMYVMCNRIFRDGVMLILHCKRAIRGQKEQTTATNTRISNIALSECESPRQIG